MKFTAVSKDIAHWQPLIRDRRRTRRGCWDLNRTLVTCPIWGRIRLLAAAAYVRNAPLVELLVAEGATMGGWTADLKVWAWRGCHWGHHFPLSPECIRVFIALCRAGGDPFKAAFGGGSSWSPFELLWRSRVDVRGLLSHPGMNAICTELRQTPLHLVANNNLSAHLVNWNMDTSNAKAGLVAAQLCAAGAAVNEPDNWGDTPLDDAARTNNREVARVLLRFGGAGRWTPPWFRAVPWSKNTHREAPPRVRGAVRALHLCAGAKHKLPRLPDEVVAMICGHWSFVAVRTA